MGYVLTRPVRQPANSPDYDVFIVFRGSRSGSMLRTVRKLAFNFDGNADWMT